MRKGFMLILFAVLVIAGSCSKDSVSSTKLTAKIGDKSWNAAVRVTNLSNNIFVITGTSLTGEVLAITINGSAVDSYELGIGKLGCTATYKATPTASSTDVFESVSGKVELTKVDKANKKISGTFQFTVAKLSLEQISITSGSFNDLEYQEPAI